MDLSDLTLNPTTTVGNNSGTMTTGQISIWPYDNGYYPYTQPVQQWFIPSTPQDCSGDVHVFPCPHCDKCKCGKATASKAKKAKQ